MKNFINFKTYNLNKVKKNVIYELTQNGLESLKKPRNAK